MLDMVKEGVRVCYLYNLKSIKSEASINRREHFSQLSTLDLNSEQRSSSG